MERKAEKWRVFCREGNALDRWSPGKQIVVTRRDGVRRFRKGGKKTLREEPVQGRKIIERGHYHGRDQATNMPETGVGILDKLRRTKINRDC